MSLKIRIIGLFTLVFIGLSVLMALLEAYVVEISAGGVIAAFVAAMVAGQYFAKAEGRVPESRESWGYSAAFLACIAVISAIQIAVLAGVDPEILQVVQSNVFWVILVVIGGVVFLSCRFFFPMGAKSQIKAAEKKAGRS